MFAAIPETVKGILTDPAGTFRKASNEAHGTPVGYFAVLLAIYALFSAIIAAFMPAPAPLSSIAAANIPLPVIVFVVTYAGVFIGTLLFGAWLHLWVAIAGGGKGMFRTIMAVLYGSTPQLLLGWIPVVGFLFTLWSLYLVVLGVHELQEISMARAILAVFIAVMVPIIFLIILASFFFIAYSTTSVAPVT